MNNIKIKNILNSVSNFKAFPSIEYIYDRLEKLSGNNKFKILEVGQSHNGKTINLVRFGNGKHKVLLIGYPHPNEPIGGLTCLGLLDLLERENEELLALDVEWNLIPCIDPDGAELNEGWSLKPFDFERFMQGYYRQGGDEQTEWSFPIEVDGYRFDTPSPMTKALMKTIREVKPDFYFSLHNAMWGGAYFFISDDIGEPYYKQLEALLEEYRIPLHLGEPEFTCVPVFAPAIYGEITFVRIFDELRQFYDRPQDHVAGGGSSFDFLKEQGMNAFTLICELPYIKHPDIENTQELDVSRRELNVKAAARKSIFLSLLRDIIAPVEGELNPTSPFFSAYLAFRDHLVKHIDKLPKSVLYDPAYRRKATVSEKFDTCFAFYLTLCFTHQLVRLLEDSADASQVEDAKDELKALFDKEFLGLMSEVDFEKFVVLEPEDLAKVQLGLGLIGLEAYLNSPSS